MENQLSNLFFNFNAFVESYLLSSHFILTIREYQHINITRKVLFPNGRPILDMLVKIKTYLQLVVLVIILHNVFM